MRCGSVIALLACLPVPALAQSVPGIVPGQVDREAQRILEQQQQQARERADTFRDARDRPPSGEEIAPEPQAPSGPGGCAPIQAVRIVGMTRYRETDFAPDIAALRGACTSIAAIDAALRAITNRYVRDGLVTSRAFVGPQDLKAGTLTITVIEGRVGAVRSAPGPSLYGSQEIAASFPVGKDALLNLRALEQGVDQLARMAKGDPRIDIAPGDVPGTSTVLVKRGPQARWLRPSLAFNNDGPASTGRWQGTASIDADSLLGIADAWSFYYQRDASADRARGSHAYGGFVSLPRGWWTLSLSAGASAYHSVLAGNGLAFATRGRSWNASVLLDRMVHRDAKTKLSLWGGLALSDTQNFIQGIQLRTGSYRIVTARAGARWQRRVGRTQVTASLGYDRGLGILGAHTVDTGPGGATGRFSLIGIEAGAQTPLALGPTRLTNTLLVRGQWGFEALFPAGRFSLGGPSTVRGFRDDGISGRSGIALREQLGFGIVDLARATPGLTTRLSGFLAYDVGAIRAVASDPFERGVLQSMSAGLRAQGRHAQGEVSVSVPLSAPAWVRHPAALVSATMRILL